MSDYQMFEVQVSQVEPLTEQVKRFTLVATDGKPLPAFTGGSHVIVQSELSQPADAGLAHHEMRNFLDFASSNVAASRRRCVAALPCATGKG